MTKTCHRHAHSSPESARRCFEKQLGRRANWKLKFAEPEKVVQIHNEPPRADVRGGVTVHVFYEARRV